MVEFFTGIGALAGVAAAFFLFRENMFKSELHITASAYRKIDDRIFLNLLIYPTERPVKITSVYVKDALICIPAMVQDKIGQLVEDMESIPDSASCELSLIIPPARNSSKSIRLKLAVKRLNSNNSLDIVLLTPTMWRPIKHKITVDIKNET